MFSLTGDAVRSSGRYRIHHERFSHNHRPSERTASPTTITRHPPPSNTQKAPPSLFDTPPPSNTQKAPSRSRPLARCALRRSRWSLLQCLRRGRPRPHRTLPFPCSKRAPLPRASRGRIASGEWYSITDWRAVSQSRDRRGARLCQYRARDAERTSVSEASAGEGVDVVRSRQAGNALTPGRFRDHRTRTRRVRPTDAAGASRNVYPSQATYLRVQRVRGRVVDYPSALWRLRRGFDSRPWTFSERLREQSTRQRRL